MSFVYPTLLLEKLFGRVKDCQDFPRLYNGVSQKNHESQILSDRALFPKIWDTKKVGNFIWLVEAIIIHAKEFSKNTFRILIWIQAFLCKFLDETGKRSEDSPSRSCIYLAS